MGLPGVIKCDKSKLETFQKWGVIKHPVPLLKYKTILDVKKPKQPPWSQKKLLF